jgi:hypothetical protein
VVVVEVVVVEVVVVVTSWIAALVWCAALVALIFANEGSLVAVSFKAEFTMLTKSPPFFEFI